MLRNIVLCLLLIVTPRFADGAVLYLVDLFNNIGRPIQLLDARTGSVWTAISPGESKGVMYWEGVTLRVSGRSLHFSRVDPPKEYTRGLFSVTFKAQLNPDLRIYLLPPNSQPPVTHTPPQPRGFPLSAR